MDPNRPSRRRFLELLPPALAAAAAAFAGVLRPARGHASTPRAAPGAPGGAARLDDHPEPRPDVDASKVLTADQLGDAPDAVPVFDAVREIPHIADGIRCHCGCADLPGYRSLLSCYEDPGMARWCVICQGEGRLAHRRWKEGQSLDQIRRAIDARYGYGTRDHATDDPAPAAHHRHG